METQTQARATGSSNDLLRMRADMQDQANERDFEAGPTARRTVCNTSDVPEGNHPHSVDGKEWHCFRDETNRLLSFAKFPRTAAKSATLLANHGFVYTGVGDATDDATTCYFCGARKKKWQASDVVSSIHHPSCPMVTETHCANVPISTNRAGEELQVQGGSMHCVEKTEIQRPDQADVDVNIHLSEESASVGGCDQTPSSIKQNERPCAMFSNLTKSKSHLPEETKVATVFSHQKSFFPERKHPSKQNTSNIKHENDKPPCNKENTFILESPKSPEYVSEDSRLRTFTTWPSEHHLKPRDLSDAGFYYENTRDLVRCFHCGGRLQNWKDTSDIRVEHARWFPNCGLVRQQLGQNFVDAVNELERTNQQELGIPRAATTAAAH
ncbi:unnamed protein product [Lymnaea stagnalis]|uniref:Uncharacterized protein n=1 Tax=Lymnaea stagnalis TaxID=6523 RepID=A0AAV2IHW8_LYMST